MATHRMVEFLFDAFTERFDRHFIEQANLAGDAKWPCHIAFLQFRETQKAKALPSDGKASGLITQHSSAIFVKIAFHPC